MIEENNNDNEAPVITTVTDCLLLLIGPSGVGKTSLLNIMNNEKEKSDCPPTFGGDFRMKDFVINKNSIVKTSVIEIPGMDQLHCFDEIYKNNADGVIFVFDLSSKTSYKTVMDELINYQSDSTRQNIMYFLIGNKNDLKREIEYEKAKEQAYENREMAYYEVTIKTPELIRRAFEEIVVKVLDSKEMQHIQHKHTAAVPVIAKSDIKKQIKCNCIVF